MANICDISDEHFYQLLQLKVLCDDALLAAMQLRMPPTRDRSTRSPNSLNHLDRPLDSTHAGPPTKWSRELAVINNGK